MPVYDWWVYIVLAIPGIFLFVMNWIIFFHNARGGKWVSGIPFFGGLWIAAVCLLSPWKWLAFIGLSDPGIWLFFEALFLEFVLHKKNDDKTEDQDTENT